jgi:hypothetical protein
MLWLNSMGDKRGKFPAADEKGCDLYMPLALGKVSLLALSSSQIPEKGRRLTAPLEIYFCAQSKAWVHSLTIIADFWF